MKMKFPMSPTCTWAVSHMELCLVSWTSSIMPVTSSSNSYLWVHVSLVFNRSYLCCMNFAQTRLITRFWSPPVPFVLMLYHLLCILKVTLVWLLLLANESCPIKVMPVQVYFKVAGLEHHHSWWVVNLMYILFTYSQWWCLSLLVEIPLLDSHTLWPVMSMLPVESLVPPLCSGWVLAALHPFLLVETSLWAVHHPTLSPSAHCVSPTLDDTLAGLLLVMTL